MGKHTTKPIDTKNEVVAPEEDWRVRLHLPPKTTSDILYNAKVPGILEPLLATNGLIFPYTPSISVQYNANYKNYDLVHSNYRGYFYEGSAVQNILINASFTAQDTNEANYFLAAMHFLRSCTKMFYGKDVQRGMPPPLLFLTGFGEFQFSNHPCAITMVSYNLPNDVDYIAAGKVSPTLQTAVNKEENKPKKEDKSPLGKLGRLFSSNIEKGAEPKKPKKTSTKAEEIPGVSKFYKKATYVPTQADISISLIPVQTRKQVSTEFSLEEYASGESLKRGFW